MRKLTTLLLITSLMAAGCSKKKQSLGQVEKGMSKDQVVSLAGEPTKKSNVGLAELWTYSDSDKVVIFRRDTVYNIIKGGKQQMDTLKQEASDVGSKISAGAKETGQDIKEEAKRVGNKIDSLSKKANK